MWEAINRTPQRARRGASSGRPSFPSSGRKLHVACLSKRPVQMVACHTSHLLGLQIYGLWFVEEL